MKILNLSETILEVLKHEDLEEDVSYFFNTNIIEKRIKAGVDLNNQENLDAIQEVLENAEHYKMIEYVNKDERYPKNLSLDSKFKVYDIKEAKKRKKVVDEYATQQNILSKGHPELEEWEYDQVMKD